MYAGRTASAAYRESRDETIRQADIVDGLTEHEDSRYDDCESYDEFNWSHREPHDDCIMCGAAGGQRVTSVPGGTVVHWSES